MLYEISKELATALKAKGVPFPVVFGPERLPSTMAARERIVIEHDLDTPESFQVARLATSNAGATNPKTGYRRLQSAKARIYARNPVSGAAAHDHRRRAEHVLDRLVTALDHVVRVRKNLIVLGSGQFVSLPDQDKSETWGGAVYDLRFQVDRGITDRNWEGDARPTVTIVEPEDDSGPHIVNQLEVAQAT